MFLTGFTLSPTLKITSLKTQMFRGLSSRRGSRPSRKLLLRLDLEEGELQKESVSKSQMSQTYSILDWIVSVIRCRLYVIALISESLLVVFLEFPIGSFPMGGDALPVFNPLQLFRYSMAWNPWVDLGSDIPQLLAGP